MVRGGARGVGRGTVWKDPGVEVRDPAIYTIKGAVSRLFERARTVLSAGFERSAGGVAGSKMGALGLAWGARGGYSSGVTAPPRRRRRVLRPLLVSAASLVAALVLCEVVLRIGNLGPAPHPTSTGKVVRPSPDPVLRFENKPHSARARVFQNRRGETPRIALYTINKHGFRGQPVDVVKPEGVFRIACVGDSFTFGTGVSDHETWPVGLRALLEDRTGNEFEVMNCGVGGYNTTQEAVFLEKRVLRFAPDLVIACLYLNDVMVGTTPPPADVPDWVRTLKRWTRPERKDWVRSLRRVSVLADLVCDRVYTRAEARFYTQRHADVFLKDGEGWQLAREALLRMRDATEDTGARFLLLLYPQMMRRGDVLASHDAYAVAREFAEGAAIACLDLEPAFLEHRVQDFWVHPTDLHPNAAGNEVAARAIGEYLLGSPLLERD